MGFPHVITDYQLQRMLADGLRLYRVATTKDVPEGTARVTYNGEEYYLAEDK